MIGANCVVEEYATLEATDSRGMKIGDWNLFEVGSKVSSASIGSGNVFEVRSLVPPNCSVGSGCVIGQLVHLPAEAERTIADNTLIIGPSHVERVKSDNEKLNMEELKPKLELLKDTLTKTHKLLKP